MDPDTTVNIVCVEDDLTIAHLLTAMLKFEGVHVLAAYTSVDAAQRSVFWGEADAAVVDWMLNGDDGGMLLRWLAEHHPQVRRVMITGGVDFLPDDVSALADDIVAKPFETATLVAAIRGR